MAPAAKCVCGQVVHAENAAGACPRCGKTLLVKSADVPVVCSVPFALPVSSKPPESSSPWAKRMASIAQGTVTGSRVAAAWVAPRARWCAAKLWAATRASWEWVWPKLVAFARAVRESLAYSVSNDGRAAMKGWYHFTRKDPMKGLGRAVMSRHVHVLIAASLIAVMGVSLVARLAGGRGGSGLRNEVAAGPAVKGEEVKSPSERPTGPPVKADATAPKPSSKEDVAKTTVDASGATTSSEAHVTKPTGDATGAKPSSKVDVAKTKSDNSDDEEIAQYFLRKLTERNSQGQEQPAGAPGPGDLVPKAVKSWVKEWRTALGILRGKDWDGSNEELLGLILRGEATKGVIAGKLDERFLGVKKLNDLVQANGGIPVGYPEKLFLADTMQTDEYLEKLVELTHLKVLSFKGVKRDGGLRLQVLSKLPWLEVLDLEGVDATDNVAGLLVGLPKVILLRIVSNRLTDGGLEKLSEIRSLKVLDVDSPQFSVSGVKKLARLEGLRKLYLHREVSEQDAESWIDALSPLTELEDLGLGLPLSEWHSLMPKMATFSGLPLTFILPQGLEQKLEYQAKPVTLELAAYKRLYGYDDFSSFDDGQPFPLARAKSVFAALEKYGAKNVKELDLSVAYTTDDDLKRLKGFSALERLRLDGCPVNGSGLVHLVELPKLRSLSLAKTHVTTESLKVLSKSKSLRTVHVGPHVDDAGLRELVLKTPDIEFYADKAKSPRSPYVWCLGPNASAFCCEECRYLAKKDFDISEFHAPAWENYRAHLVVNPKFLAEAQRGANTNYPDTITRFKRLKTAVANWEIVKEKWAGEQISQKPLAKQMIGLFLKDGVAKVESNLIAADAKDRVRNHPCKVFGVTLAKGRTYQLDMMSKQVDSFLRLEDATGQELLVDDDSGGGLNARIQFTCSKEGEYRIVATTFLGGTGSFILTVTEK